MTETLAKLYFEQNKFKEAIKAYEILMFEISRKNQFICRPNQNNKK